MSTNSSDAGDSATPSAHTKLPRTVWLLSWVSFFADVSSEMVYPLLPLFMISVVGASKTQLGAMEGGAVLLVSVMSAYAGFRSDRSRSAHGRTGWIRWGYGLPVLGKAVIAFATVWPMAIGGRLLDRFGKGLRGAPRDALIADAVPAELRGRAFGLHRTLDTAGALLGVVLSACLLAWLIASPDPNVQPPIAPSGWVLRTIIGVGAVLGLVSWLLTFLVQEPTRLAESEAAIKGPSEASAVSAVPTSNPGLPDRRLPASYWAVIGLLVLFSLANSSDTFLLLKVSELGYSPVAVVVVYALFNVTYTLLSYPFGAMSDRQGRWCLIAAGWFIYSVVYVCLAFVHRENAWAVWPLMALYGVYMALTDGVGKALIADHAPRAQRGTCMGIYYAITGATTFLASIVAGYAWDVSGSKLTLLIGAGLSMAALIVLGILMRTKLMQSIQ
ncbi:MAG: MFS transporter [Pirellula sp.]